MIGNAYGDQNGQGQNGQGQNGQGQNGQGQHAVPEIATGAAISAFLLAGGSLLLLSDRIRKKKSTSY
ncbi:MAG: hypothetical protein JO114_18695 [Planctomycetaceae bacterium]|nr:hypothetical protein [Planctomycetaceae bacterium]